MLESIKELTNLASKSKKIWILPIVLFLIIITLVIIAAQASPVPLFIYPII